MAQFRSFFNRLNTAVRAPRRSPLLQVGKSAVATIVAWLLASWFIAGPPPVFAAIAALLVVQPSVDQSLAKALERSAGVIAGVVVASGLALVFGDSTWVVLVAIASGLLIAWASKMTAATGNQVAISALLVLSLGQSTPDYAVDRILETILGAAIGVVINLLIVPPVLVSPARDKIGALGEEVAASLDRIAVALTAVRTRAQLEEILLTSRLMRPMQISASEAIAAAEESLTINPRARAHRAELAELSAELDLFSPIVTQIIGMARATYDRYDPAIVAEPAARAIAEQLRRAAHDVRLIQRHERNATRPRTAPVLTSQISALTSPLDVLAPSSSNWVLIGSLLEDLRRIHENLSGR